MQQCGQRSCRAAAQLSQGLLEAHQRALTERAADPSSRDEAAAHSLARAVTGGNITAVVSADVTSLGVELITTLGVRAEAGGGLSYEQAALGACLRTTALPGSVSGEADGRGTVRTQAVPCPDGVVPVADGAPVEAVTTALQPRRSDVPAPRTNGCLSGSEDCAGG